MKLVLPHAVNYSASLCLWVSRYNFLLFFFEFISVPFFGKSSKSAEKFTPEELSKIEELVIEQSKSIDHLKRNLENIRSTLPSSTAKDKKA